MSQKIRVFEAFAGYGSQSLALKRLSQDYPDFQYEVVGISEIDKFAIQAYNALHPNVPNFGDISKIDWDTVPDFDLFTWSFPCTDISMAGKQAGLAEGSGTRSSLAFECFKAIENKRPKYLLMENVKALTQRKFASDFQKLQQRLNDLGYDNFYQVLNAKDYGIPQNRERVFMISVKRERERENSYRFPDSFTLDKRLKDILEKHVDEKYYLKKSQVERIINHCARKESEGCGFRPAIKDGGGYCYDHTDQVRRTRNGHLPQNGGGY
jgi:DNA (cytosine-5)-methyltransferase 1